MKFYGSILALCAILPQSSAFYAQAPKTTVSPLFGYSGNNEPGAPPAVRAVGPGGPAGAVSPAEAQRAKDIWETSSPVLVQGSTLRTWSFPNPQVERVQVLMKTEGRPLHANIELWQGPDNTPQKLGVYIEDGSVRPFCAVIETPRGPNAVAVYNTGNLEFPFSACVEAAGPKGPVAKGTSKMTPRTIQGGALHTYPFAPQVQSVQVLLKTDGRPLNARIELLQGPNNIKQVMELYTEDGLERPFYCIIESPGSGNVVRVLNTAPMEFPLSACVEPYLVENGPEVTISEGLPGGNLGELRW